MGALVPWRSPLCKAAFCKSGPVLGHTEASEGRLEANRARGQFYHTLGQGSRLTDAGAADSVAPLLWASQQLSVAQFACGHYSLFASASESALTSRPRAAQAVYHIAQPKRVNCAWPPECHTQGCAWIGSP